MPLLSRDMRAIASGVAVVLSGVFGLRVLPALHEWSGAQERRVVRSSIAVADARASVSHGPALRDSLRARREALADLDSMFVFGSSPSRGAAILLSELSEDAEIANVRLESQQPDSAADADAVLRRVRVRGSLSAEFSDFLQFLVLVESGPRVLSVREVAVSRRTAASADQAALIHASFVVEGLLPPARPRTK